MSDAIPLYHNEQKSNIQDNISIFFDGGYAPHTLIRTTNHKLKSADSLCTDDIIESINSKGALVLTLIKNIVEGTDYLYSIDYGHDHKIIEVTGKHKFKTRCESKRVHYLDESSENHKCKIMYGAKRVDCLDIENDFLCTIQEDSSLCWVSINSITLKSPLKMPIVNIYTFDINCILLQGEVISYNYSSFRHLRELWNRDIL
jgi:hypothetical protein